MISCCRMINVKCSEGGRQIREEGIHIFSLFYQALYKLEILIHAFLVLM